MNVQLYYFLNEPIKNFGWWPIIIMWYFEFLLFSLTF